MSLPSTWISFCGREVARHGSGGVVVIDFGPLSVRRKSAVHEFVESEKSEVEDLGNQSVSFSFTVDREFETHAQKRRWLLRHLAEVQRGAGELKIIEDGEVFSVPNAVLSAEVSSEIGVAVSIRYTAQGGEIKQLLFKSR